MLLTLKNQSLKKQAEHMLEQLKKTIHVEQVATNSYVVCSEVTNIVEVEKYFNVEKINSTFKIVSRQTKLTAKNLWQNLGLEADQLLIIGGPCAVESEQQIMQIAKFVSKLGVKFLRAGIFKPRTSPYSFQGAAEQGLAWLCAAAKRYDLKIVSELMSEEQVVAYAKYIDVIQIGARNMQNYELLKVVGKTQKPVLLKRGLCATIEEFLMAAEYIVVQGNRNIILCERGIRSYEGAYRNVTDLNAVTYLQQQTYLPIVVDPSHATGNASMVEAISRASIAAGADGLIIETHNDPQNALSDSEQTIDQITFSKICNDVQKLKKFLGELDER